MGIIVPIIEVLFNDEIKGRGEFEFSHLPGPGDQIVFPSNIGGLDIMKVLYVEHSPVPLPRKFYNESKEASLKIYVEFIYDEY